MAFALACRARGWIGGGSGTTACCDAIGFATVEFVDEAYDRAILITFSKGFQLPAWLHWFSSPGKDAHTGRNREAGEDRVVGSGSGSGSARRLHGAGGGDALAEQQAKIEPTPAPAQTQGRISRWLGKINTAPIRDVRFSACMNHTSPANSPFPTKLRVGFGSHKCRLEP